MFLLNDKGQNITIALQNNNTIKKIHTNLVNDSLVIAYVLKSNKTFEVQLKIKQNKSKQKALTMTYIKHIFPY